MINIKEKPAKPILMGKCKKCKKKIYDIDYRYFEGNDFYCLKCGEKDENKRKGIHEYER